MRQTFLLIALMRLQIFLNRGLRGKTNYSPSGWQLHFSELSSDWRLLVRHDMADGDEIAILAAFPLKGPKNEDTDSRVLSCRYSVSRRNQLCSSSRAHRRLRERALHEVRVPHPHARRKKALHQRLCTKGHVAAVAHHDGPHTL